MVRIRSGGNTKTRNSRIITRVILREEEKRTTYYTMMMMTTMLCIVALFMTIIFSSFNIIASSSDTRETNSIINNTTKSMTTIIKPTVGFGTAGLGTEGSYQSVLYALDAGFRIFDTAEADYWYDQEAVGRALKHYFVEKTKECIMTEMGEEECFTSDPASVRDVCYQENLQISTKIGPWDLISEQHIRSNAANSRTILLGFCDDDDDDNSNTNNAKKKYPLDVYYIHAPTCWSGWHHRCNDVGELLDLRSAWLAMEAIVSIDQSAKRIGLSNVSPSELLDIIEFVQQRQVSSSHTSSAAAIPRIPDVIQAYSDPYHPATELREICTQYNIEFVSYSTLGTQHVMREGGRNPVLEHPTIIQLANQYSRSNAEIVLSWALQHNMSIIPRSRNVQHIQQLARLLISSSSNSNNHNGFLNPIDLRKIDMIANEE